MSCLPLILQLPLNHDLRGDAGIVCARNPRCIETLHAVKARERIHDRLVKRMAHVQRARQVGRRQLNREIFAFDCRFAARLPCAASAGVDIAPFFSFRAPDGFNGLWIERFCDVIKSELRGFCCFKHGRSLPISAI